MHEMAEEIERSCGERLPLFSDSRLMHTAASLGCHAFYHRIYLSGPLLCGLQSRMYSYQVLTGTLRYGISLRSSVTFLTERTSRSIS